ncbi:hypothetical protein ABEB36_004093 [Hypothenemus hampei]|uniref:CCHC-type domain-containing protein n=1 Tax=Hypothenemus hampei TaxID=57062 RepID=A0ABD1F254_HYPHA
MNEEMNERSNDINVLENVQIQSAKNSLMESQESILKRNEITADKLSLTLDAMSSIMIGANQMLTKISEISNATLETEKIKLKQLEIKKTSTGKRSVEDDVLKESNQGFIDKSMQVIKTTIETGINNNKINIKRDYNLSQKTNFELWLDYLKSELQSNDLLDVIDDSIKNTENYSEYMIQKRKGLVRDIIINHIDENYHKRILNEKEPKEILKRLKLFKKGESNVTHTSVRARLYQIKMGTEEKVIDFCERFHSIVREYESTEDAVPLTEQEKRSSFYQAVSGVIPELRNADLIRRQTSLREMTLDEIKSFITQLEAEKSSEVNEEVKAQKAVSIKQTKRCHRCNEQGHWAVECPLQGTGKWFCYYCQSIRTHKGSDCHLAKAVKKGHFRGKFSKTNSKHRNESEQKNYTKADEGEKFTDKLLEVEEEAEEEDLTEP